MPDSPKDVKTGPSQTGVVLLLDGTSVLVRMKRGVVKIPVDFKDAPKWRGRCRVM